MVDSANAILCDFDIDTSEECEEQLAANSAATQTHNFIFIEVCRSSLEDMDLYLYL